jgi:predicted Zn-dependent protease
MLFDLRSRGRRTTVRVVYGGVAIIFVIAFVGAGVGTGFGGNFSIGELFGGGGGSKTYGAAVQTAEKHTKREPSNPAAWQALTEAQLRQSSEPEYSNQTSEGFTTKGKQLLAHVQQSWERYLALAGNHPSPALAHKMISVLGEGGTEQPKAEVQALQIVIPSEAPSVILYTELAQYSYQAGNTRQADLAAEKAIALAPKAERARVKGVLAALKKNHGHPNSSAASSEAAGASEEG